MNKTDWRKLGLEGKLSYASAGIKSAALGSLAFLFPENNVKEIAMAYTVTGFLDLFHGFFLSQVNKYNKDEIDLPTYALVNFDGYTAWMVSELCRGNYRGKNKD